MHHISQLDQRRYLTKRAKLTRPDHIDTVPQTSIGLSGGIACQAPRESGTLKKYCNCTRHETRCRGVFTERNTEENKSIREKSKYYAYAREGIRE